MNNKSTKNGSSTDETLPKKSLTENSAQADQGSVAQNQDDNTIAKKAEELGIALISTVPKIISSDVISIIPEEVSQKYRIVAFEKNDNCVRIAMVDPQNMNALNALRFIAEKEKLEIEIYLASEETFDQMHRFYVGTGAIIKKAVLSLEEDKITSGADEADKQAQMKTKEVLRDAPVAKLVQVIISHAIDGKASDIHIEPMDSEYRVRFRVDGILHVSLIIPKEIGPAIISRIKILANLKIDEKRKPQDGRFRLTNNGKEIDFRVSSLPVIEGEKVVMRILDKDTGLAKIELLGLMGTALDNMQQAIKETYGMILFTGPTGSGKSTSLYALLKILNNEERNIITLEDPIEYHIEGLNQSQTQPDIGYTFASGLRTILRQDPNVIMVGEIRDGETAELAVHAALTGHLMFSTLHTNTAIGAIPRLIDMGIEPFLLSSALRLVASQRLVRKICEDCRVPKDIPESVKKNMLEGIKNIPENELKKIGVDLSKEMKFYHGKGCDKCNGTGLRGRLAIYEVVPVTDNIKNIITENKGSEELINKEREAMGIITMRQDGILKIIMGLTTIEEVERVTEGSMTLTEEND